MSQTDDQYSAFEKDLLRQLNILEEATAKVLQSTGYRVEAKNMKLLAEMIREQIRNESLMHSTGTIR